MLNLTQHRATPAQEEAGVVGIISNVDINKLLTFNELPTRQVLLDRANQIADIARIEISIWKYPPKAMIGGFPALMRPLEDALIRRGITPYYAFSLRNSKEYTKENGVVVKEGEFEHLGFIEVE